MEDEDPIVSKEDVRKLILALAENEGGVCESDAERLYEWARQTRVNHNLLELVLQGEIGVIVQPFDIEFFKREGI